LAYWFAPRAVEGSILDHLHDGKAYVALKGSFTTVKHPDGWMSFGYPERLQWNGPKRPIPDLLDLPHFCLSRRARDLIEQWEPGVHTFVPVEFVWSDGSLAERRYFLRFRRSFDAVSAEHSTWRKESGVLWRPAGLIDERLVFDTRLIGSAHLWQNEGMAAPRRYYASDALAECMIAAGLSGVLLRRYDQIEPDGSLSPPSAREQVFFLHAQSFKGTNGREDPLDGDLNALEPEQNLDPASAVSFATGIRLSPKNMPSRVWYGGSAKIPGDLSFGYHGLPTVSARLKDIIEGVEPAVHQFFPVDFVSKKGSSIEKRYILVVARQIDGASPEHSSMLRSRNFWYNIGQEPGELVFDRRLIGEAHMWRDPSIIGTPVLVSQRMAEAIHGAGLRGPVFGPCELV
jgi:hypothetical protein